MCNGDFSEILIEDFSGLQNNPRPPALRLRRSSEVLQLNSVLCVKFQGVRSQSGVQRDQNVWLRTNLGTKLPS